MAFTSNSYSQSLYDSTTEPITLNSSFDLDQTYTFANDQSSFDFAEAANSVDETLGFEEEAQA